jgi:hypothetical protein
LCYYEFDFYAWTCFRDLKATRHVPCYRSGDSRRPLTAEALVQTQGSIRGIFGEQRGRPSISPDSIIPPLLHIHSCIIWGWTMGQLTSQFHRDIASHFRNNNKKNMAKLRNGHHEGQLSISTQDGCMLCVYMNSSIFYDKNKKWRSNIELGIWFP